ncbi:MAG: hypothetical protein EP336_09355 [Rhodobacteraceae bacterium]|nr:MAG: hypothetical protein EP336_09355 [Paracoccaceae bacterium]
MTEAPKYMWRETVKPNRHTQKVVRFTTSTTAGSRANSVKYFREDVALAMVAAAYEDALLVVRHCGLAGDADIDPMSVLLTERTPDDAKSALASMIEDAQRKAIAAALEEVEEVCQNREDVLSDDDDLSDWSQGASLCLSDIRDIDQDALVRKVMSE